MTGHSSQVSETLLAFLSFSFNFSMNRIEELEVDDETEETHPRALSPHLLYDVQDVSDASVDVDALFHTKSVEEIRAVSDDLKARSRRKQEDLRQLIGCAFLFLP